MTGTYYAGTKLCTGALLPQDFLDLADLGLRFARNFFDSPFSFQLAIMSEFARNFLHRTLHLMQCTFSLVPDA